MFLAGTEVSVNGNTAALKRSRRSARIHAGGRCELRCALCDCASPPTSRRDISRILQGGGSDLVVRGACEGSDTIDEIIGRAREEGYADIVVRTNAVWCTSVEAAAAFSRRGADAILVPLFSNYPAVHDRIAGRSGALGEALVGVRHLAAAGMAVEIEVPILQARLQSVVDVVALAQRAAPGLRAVRLYTPDSPHPVLAPPTWDDAGPLLAAVLLHCREHGIRAQLSIDSGIPLCALREYGDLLDCYSINPKARSSLRDGAVLGEGCAHCAVSAHCPGVVSSYVQAHGESGLAAYDRRPKLLYEQRTTRRREWTDEQRRAASQATLMVLRPTVNCNQDCTFCSANETSSNVWANHDEMLRAIARAAGRGIGWISFSGGEPTLSKYLVEYVRCATRLGIARREIVSNAVLLDRETKVAALVEAGLTDAFISLHAHDESLSQQSTQKIGDFSRTIAGIRNLLNAGVRTALNHVITARNYPYLQAYVEMVHREFDGRVKISFAFVTPQFKALDHIEVMPRLSDIIPYLKRAMYRALALEQPFAVGSRQGIPFCFLGEFRAWSDGLKLSKSAIAEDSPQKQRSEVCDSCRFSDYCTGLWRPYVATYGLTELNPVDGARLSDGDVAELDRVARAYPWGEPMSFDEVSPIIREPELETGPPKVVPLPLESQKEPTLYRSRPLRVLMIGSGRQARRLARAAVEVAAVSIDAVASPHAPQAQVQEFGNCPAYSDAVEAIDDIRPEAAIIAAATKMHAELATLCLRRGVPVLLEKPVAASIAEAEAVRNLAAEVGVDVVPAHNTLHAAGLEEVFALDYQRPRIAYTWRRTGGSSDTMLAWSRSFLYESLYHLLAITGRVAGGGVARVIGTTYRGEGRPELIRVNLRYGNIDAEMVLEFAASREEDILNVSEVDDPASEVVWSRLGRETTLSDGRGVRAVGARGSDIGNMLANFRDVVLQDASPMTNMSDALDVMRSTENVVDAVEAAGAPFNRNSAPRHVASRELRRPHG